MQLLPVLHIIPAASIIKFHLFLDVVACIEAADTLVKHQSQNGLPETAEVC